MVSRDGRRDRRAAPPRADRPEHRRGRAARPPRRGAGRLLLRLRPDRAEPARRAPAAVHGAARAAAGRPPARRPGRRRHRADRRPAPDRRSGSSTTASTVADWVRAHPRAGRAVPRPAGRDRRAEGPDLRRQPRLDGAALGDRLPARPRQALPGQPDAGQGGGVGPAELRGRHQLHRVQLPDPAGQRLPRAVPPARRHAADRRLRPVGQPDRRHRPGPPRSRAPRCTPCRRRW